MTYPNIFYLVSYHHATSGLFIRILLDMMLYGRNCESIDFPINGTAEIVLPWPRPINYTIDPEYVPGTLNKNFYDYITPVDSNMIPPYWEHTHPNWNKLFNKFPNCKNIVIQVSDDTLLRQQANSYCKRKYKFIKNLNEINQKNDEITLKKSFNDVYKKQNLKYLIGEPYITNSPMPSEFNKNIITLQLYDIIHNKEKIFETLELVTGKSIFHNLIISYDNYLKRQHDLMPWLDDK